MHDLTWQSCQLVHIDDDSASLNFLKSFCHFLGFLGTRVFLFASYLLLGAGFGVLKWLLYSSRLETSRPSSLLSNLCSRDYDPHKDWETHHQGGEIDIICSSLMRALTPQPFLFWVSLCQVSQGSLLMLSHHQNESADKPIKVWVKQLTGHL